jgi:hypothetical protein
LISNKLTIRAFGTGSRFARPVSMAQDLQLAGAKPLDPFVGAVAPPNLNICTLLFFTLLTLNLGVLKSFNLIY